MVSPLRVFISHTSELASNPGPMTWVGAVQRAVRDQRHAGVEMAHFGVSPESPEEVCRREVEGCQVWVGLLGSRYGSIVQDRTDISYTEMEFEVATDNGMPRLAFLVDDGTSGDRCDGVEDADRREAFRRRVLKSGIVVKRVATPVDLFTAAFAALHRLGDLRPDPRTLGEPTPVMPLRLRDGHEDADSLRERLLIRQDPVMALVGEDGTGKTALVSQAFHGLKKERSSKAFGLLDYISASSHVWITGDFVLGRLLQAVGSSGQRAALTNRLQARRESWYDLVEEVLNALDDDVLIVIDQVEILLDDRGLLAEPTLNQLVTHLSRRGDHRASILLVTSRPPSGQLVGHRRTALWQLPRVHRNDDEAVAFLRGLAPQLPVNLATDPALAVSLAGRHPRTLELLVAAFSLDTDLTLDDLVPLAGLSDRERVADLARTLVSVMPGEMWHVVCIAAVLGLPATARDLAAILGDNPAYARRGEIGALLETLRELRIMRATPDDSSGGGKGSRYYLPAAEAECIISSASGDGRYEEELQSTRRDAAAHLARSRDGTTAIDPQNLAPLFREIELRLQLGPAEHRTCVELMDAVADRSLRRWGRRYVLMPWRRKLLDWHGHEGAWRSNISQMVAAAVELDELDEAGQLLNDLLERITSLPRPSQPEAAAQLAADELIVLGQLGHTAFHDGRLSQAQEWHERELGRASTPADQCAAHLGLGAALRELGCVERAGEHLDASWQLLHDAHDQVEHGWRAHILLVRAELARLRGDLGGAENLIEQARHASPEARIGVQLLDLRVGLLLDASVDGPDQDFLLTDAVEVAGRAAEEAAKMGVVDATRTAHALLALALLRRGDVDDLESARKAALSAAGFFGGKRGLVAHIVLGMVQLRDRRRPGADQRARACFYDAVHAAERFSVAHGRPYWVWDAIGAAETGLHLCRVPGARSRAVEAFRQAREAAPHPGAVRRAVLYVDTLAVGTRKDALADILVAARGEDIASIRGDETRRVD